MFTSTDELIQECLKTVLRQDTVSRLNITGYSTIKDMCVGGQVNRLRRELEQSQAKIASLNSHLNTNVCQIFCVHGINAGSAAILAVVMILLF